MDQYYLPGDLETFFDNLAPNVPQNYLPTVASIDGGTLQPSISTEDWNHNSEPDLDFEYAIALGIFSPYYVLQSKRSH